MCNFRGAIASSLIACAAWMATTSPSPADTGSVHVLFSKAGIIAAVGNGTGVLTFHGKKYPFDVWGASFGATLALSVNEFVGRAENLRVSATRRPTRLEEHRRRDRARAVPVYAGRFRRLFRGTTGSAGRVGKRARSQRNTAPARLGDHRSAASLTSGSVKSYQVLATVCEG